jgi:hypothetical protein
MLEARLVGLPFRLDEPARRSWGALDAAKRCITSDPSDVLLSLGIPCIALTAVGCVGELIKSCTSQDMINERGM